MTNANNSKILFTVFFTIFIDLLGVGVLIPVYPLLILPTSPFKVTPSTWSISDGFVLLGWLSASFPLAQFLCAPILGQLADRFGRKKILAISTAGTSFGYILFAIAILTKNIPLLFLSRIMDGCTGGNISVAQAVIADVSTPKNRAKNFGLIGMAFGMGFIIGPFIGGVLSDHTTVSWFNAATPFYFAAILNLINVASILKFLPETLKVATAKRLDITKPFSNITKAFTSNGLQNIMPSVFLYNSGFTLFVTFFAVILANKYHFKQIEVGNYFAYVGIMILLSQLILVRLLSGRVPDYKVLRMSMFGTAVVILSYYFIPANHSFILYLLPPLMAMANSTTMSFNASLITRVAPVNVRGEALGINASIIALAQSFPAILSGYVAGIGPTLPLLFGSGMAILAGICFWLLFNPLQHTNTQYT